LACTWRERDILSDRQGGTLCPFLLILFFSVINLGWVNGVLNESRTERDGRDEQDTTIPSEDSRTTRKGNPAARFLPLLPAFLICLLLSCFSSFVGGFGFRRALEGKYTRGLRECFFELVSTFWRLVLYTLENEVIPVILFSIFCA
jgi:hypothetical protein